MLFLVVSDNRTFRSEHIAKLASSTPETIVFDDTYGTVVDLERYVYPSLFNPAPPVVQVKFMLGSSDTLTTPFLKKLLASPTTFIFEELSAPAATVNLFKKAGAIVHVGEKVSSSKKDLSIFSVAQCLTATDKKTRWMLYRQALDAQPIEAIMGILYWKVRDLIIKQPRNASQYKKLYEALITAHAHAWESGVPLELAIEKVILEF